MKTTILSIAIAAIFASCSNNKPAEQGSATATVPAADTIGLSEFKEWKDKQEAIATQQTFTSEGINESAPAVEEIPAAKPAPVIIYRDAPVKQPKVTKSTRTASRKISKYPSPEVEPESPGIAKAPAPVSSGTKREPYGRNGSGGETGAGNETSTSGEGDVAVSKPAEVPAKNEGWSKAAKGTAIGGTSGAVIGAVISKNKTKGAVIGGIVGAAGGYIFGRKQDKKEGRY